MFAFRTVTSVVVIMKKNRTNIITDGFQENNEK